MKPFEEFVGQMMEAARLAQAKDPRAATDVIQEALKAAGLVPSETPDRAAAAGPGMVDLNAAPEWSQVVRRAAEAVPKSGRRLRWTVPERKQRAPVHDPRAPGEFLERSFETATGAHRYKLYVPSKPATGPRPLVVMLHGCTQDPDDFAAGTAMNALAEEHDCLVLYPEQTRAANATLCWNWFEAPNQRRDGPEPSMIAGMTRAVMADWNADPGRVYVAGLSAGGAMAAVMGAAYPDLFAAVGVHSGLPVGKARDLITGLAAMKKVAAKKEHAGDRLRQRVPVIVFHGDRDDIVHPDNGEAVLEQFVRHTPGSPEEALRRTQEHGNAYTKTAMVDSAGRSVAEYWELHGAGHAWSGGSPAGSYTNPGGIDASAEMLRFFLGQVG